MDRSISKSAAVKQLCKWWMNNSHFVGERTLNEWRDKWLNFERIDLPNFCVYCQIQVLQQQVHKGGCRCVTVTWTWGLLGVIRQLVLEKWAPYIIYIAVIYKPLISSITMLLDVLNFSRSFAYWFCNTLAPCIFDRHHLIPTDSEVKPQFFAIAILQA